MLINGVSLKFLQFILNGGLWYIVIKKIRIFSEFLLLHDTFFLSEGWLDIFSASYDVVVPVPTFVSTRLSRKNKNQCCYLISVLVNSATSKPMLMKFGYPVQTEAYL